MGRHACGALSLFESAHQDDHRIGLEAPNASARALKSSRLSTAGHGQGDRRWGLRTGKPAMTSGTSGQTNIHVVLRQISGTTRQETRGRCDATREQLSDQHRVAGKGIH